MLQQILKTNELFNDFSEDELFLLIRLCEEVHVKKGDVIFKENDDHDRSAYFIQEGIVKIIKGTGEKQKVLAMFGMGNLFGEMSFLDAQNRSASAIADEHAILFKLSPASMNVLEKTSPTTAVKLLKVFIVKLTTRLRHTDDFVISKDDRIIVI